MLTMNKKIILIIASVIFLTFLLGALIFYYFNLRGIGPAIGKAPADITKLIPGVETLKGDQRVLANTDQIVAPAKTNNATSPLRLPIGFSIGIFAKNLPDARVMIFDSVGNIWLSQTGQGIVSKLTINKGKLIEQKVVLSGLKNPHGLAFDPQDPSILYVAEENKISKTVITNGVASRLQKIIDLPTGGNHFSRTLGFGPDGRLYVSIGSTCNVCLESDSRRAAIYSLNKDGSDWRQVAQGLRNSVFFIWNKADKMMWATDMGRDLLGDDIPPDEINIINTASKSVLNFGWPICYGQNIHDTAFDKNVYFRNPCQAPFELPSHIDLQAHSAPLGLAFVPDNSSWPKEYKNNLLVAFHGSWNRSVPTGYKVVRLILDKSGNLVSQTDFISGWLTKGGAIGRPVDLIFDNSGALYISDDKAGVIYKVFTP
jgi:glucose/arabinose dehydrogenase